MGDAGKFIGKVQEKSKAFNSENGTAIFPPVLSPLLHVRKKGGKLWNINTEILILKTIVLIIKALHKLQLWPPSQLQNTSLFLIYYYYY